MYYGAIKHLDIANGPGIRVSLFVSGCRNHCDGCFQPETWAFDYGHKFTGYTFQNLLYLIDNPHVVGLSILGGDPFEPENQSEVLELCKTLKFLRPAKTIWMWTGYLWEDVKDLPVLQYVDVLVDGPFVKELKNLSLAYRGSSNQRVIDVAKSLTGDQIVEWKMDIPMG
ncbi:MAG: anaerobic ribonucleoside-triphosphate reductase activating protein [Oscillospiraceae bacterium]|nr:anaerobic ribonucleoside-triphosphate reductase activating protein [Oscillospiraceae bacterium]